jgi:hypothetical protein
MKHLVDRFREGRISVDDFDALQDWLSSNPEVPLGKWYKQYPRFTLAGEGEVPKTFLAPGMVPHGTEVRSPLTPPHAGRRNAHGILRSIGCGSA